MLFIWGGGESNVGRRCERKPEKGKGKLSDVTIQKTLTLKYATSRPVIHVASGSALAVNMASPGIIASSGSDASRGQSLGCGR